MLQAKQPSQQASTDLKAIFRELGRLHRAGYHTKYKKLNNTTLLIVEKSA